MQSGHSSHERDTKILLFASRLNLILIYLKEL